MEKRKNGKRRQKLITESWFSFSQYTWPLSRCTLVPNFKILGAVVPEKYFDTNFPMYYNGVRDGKRRQKLISASWFSFPQYTLPLSRCIQNLKAGSHISLEICDKFLLERKKTRSIKGMISRRPILLHNTLYPKFVPNFKILASVVPEKSLTKKKVYTHNTHTYIHTLLLKRQKPYIDCRPKMTLLPPPREFCRHSLS